MSKGTHRRPSVLERLTRRQPNLGVRATIARVDLRTGITHLLTPDAAAAGRVRTGRYIALCGAEVIPAAMTEPGRGDCQPCTTACGRSVPARGLTITDDSSGALCMTCVVGVPAGSKDLGPTGTAPRSPAGEDDDRGGVAGVADYREMLGRPVVNPGRGVCTSPRLPAVLSAAWQAVAG